MKPLTDAYISLHSGKCAECEQLKGQIARLRKKVLHEATTAPMSAITRMRLRKAVTST